MPMLSLQDVQDLYHDNLLSNKGSRGYQWLEGQGINTDSTIKELGIGFADKTILPLLAPRQNKEGREERKNLQELGILKNTGFEALLGITFPFYEEGKLVNIYSYAIGQRSRGNMVSLNKKGSITIGTGTKVIYTDNPLNALILVGLDLHLDFVIYCSLDSTITLEGDIYALCAMDWAYSYRRVDMKVKLTEYFNRGGSKQDLLDLIQEAPLIEVPTSTNEPIAERANNTTSDEVRFDGKHYYTQIGSNHYRITGLERNQGFHSLKITLKLWEFELYFIDTIDLTVDKQRVKFVTRSSEELGIAESVIKADLGKLLLIVEQLQENRFAQDKLEPTVELSAKEIEQAINYLKQPNLLEVIQNDFEECGVVGEQVNRIVGYLCCTSRLLAKPLAVIVQSSSAAGKTTLMNAVLSFFPEEEQLNYSSLTGQSLYYLGDTNIDKKILSIAEEEGASRASYALKLLLSEGELSIATTGKDQETGATTTIHYKVKGRVMLFLTTTALEVDEELQNRCLVLSVDERPEQTQAIHLKQKHARTMGGIIQQKQAQLIKKQHHNLQRVLKPYVIVNPFIDHLSFNSSSTRTRRDHEKYLTLIESITLLHQYQRKVVKKEVEGEIIEALVVDPRDVELANNLAVVIFQTALDCLPAHTRKVWDKIKELLKSSASKQKLAWYQVTFTRREVRELAGLSVTGVKVHIQRLIEAEYVTTVSNEEGSSYTYKSLVSPSEQESFDVLGLLSR